MNRVPRAYALLLVLLTAISGAPAYALDQVTVQLGWLPGGDRTQYFVGKQRGFFAAEGLDVRVLGGKGANDAITKVATGVADFGEAGLDAVLTARLANDVPVVVVMSMFTKMPDALITTAGSGIGGLKDVAGKRVATTAFTTSNAPWPFLLRQNGVDPSSVTLIKADPTALGPMLASGQVDGVIQFVTQGPAMSAALAAAGKQIRTLAWADYGLEGYSNAIVVSKATLRDRRDIVVRFVRALKKAEVAMKEDPAAAAAALKNSVPETDEVLARKMVDASMPLMFNAVTDRDGLGALSPDLVQTTWTWIAKEQGVPLERLNPMDSVDPSIAR